MYGSAVSMNLHFLCKLLIFLPLLSLGLFGFRATNERRKQSAYNHAQQLSIRCSRFVGIKIRAISIILSYLLRKNVNDFIRSDLD